MSETFWDRRGLYGLMAEFEHPEELVKAAQRTYDSGYRKIDAYSPMPVEGLAEAIGFHRNAVSKLVLGAGLTGCIGGFGFLDWVTPICFPAHQGGGPPKKVAVDIPVTFSGAASLWGVVRGGGARARSQR